MKNLKNKLVSVIIPVYNVRGYLERCINSILEQTYKKIEVIIVDDGSTDDGGEICDSYQLNDDRVTVVHQKNAGLSAARNRGINICKGEYICFIDSDDFVAIDFIERLVLCLESSCCDIAQCKVRSFVEQSELTNLVKEKDYNVYNGAEMCHNLLMNKIKESGVVQNKLYKRYLFEEEHFREGRIHEDEFLVYKLFYKSRVAVLEAELYYYQSKRKESITHAAYSIKRLDALDAARERITYFTDKNENMLRDEAILAYCRTLDTNILLLKESALHNRNELLNELYKELKTSYIKVVFSKYIPLKNKVGVGVRMVDARLR